MKWYKAVCLMLCFLFVLFILCACKSVGTVVESMPDAHINDADAFANNSGSIGQYAEKIAEEKLTITRGSSEYKQHILIYPFVLAEVDSGDNPNDKLNTLIYDSLTKALNAYSEAQISKYRVKCNTAGVLSVMMEVSDLRYSETSFLLPLTYDTHTNAELKVSDLFDLENERWRSLIPDIITVQAEGRKLVLLNEVMPIADDQLFYLTETAIVFVYRPYEICTYTIAWPEFSIPIHQLADFFTDESPLHRLLQYSLQQENIELDEVPLPMWEEVK